MSCIRICHSELDMSLMYDLLRSWAENCAATSETNGVNLLTGLDSVTASNRASPSRRARGMIKNAGISAALPMESVPSLPPTDGSSGVIKSFILPDNTTGVASDFPLLPRVTRGARLLC